MMLMQACGDPVRVQCMYERALARFPVTHHLWLCYARYLELHLKLPDLIDAVYARALRNCPWVGMLWCRWAKPTLLGLNAISFLLQSCDLPV